MGQTQRQQLTWMVCILLVLVGAIVLFPSPQPVDGISTQTPLVTQFDAGKTRSIELTHLDWTVSVSHDGSAWSWPYETDPPLDQEKVATVQDLFQETTCVDYVLGHPKDFALEPPLWAIRTTSTDGVEHEVHVGMDSPVSQNSYARVSGSVDICLTSEKLSRYLPDDRSWFWSRRLVVLDSAPVDEVVIRSTGPVGWNGRFVQKPDGWWTEDGAFRADGVPDFIVAVEGLNITSFEAPDLGESSSKVTLRQSGRVHELMISDSNRAVSTRFPMPVSIDASNLIPQRLEDLYTQSLIAKGATKSATVDVRLGEVTFHSDWIGHGWREPQTEIIASLLEVSEVTRGHNPTASLALSGIEGDPWGAISLRGEAVVNVAIYQPHDGMFIGHEGWPAEPFIVDQGVIDRLIDAVRLVQSGSQ